jgi:hypothetical protein
VPPVPPVPPVPVVNLGTDVVVVIFVVVVLMDGDDVLAATKFNEHAANTAAVEAKRKLLFLVLLPAELPAVLDVDAADVVVEVNRKGDDADATVPPIGNKCIPAAVDKAREDIGEDGIFCRFGPRTIVEVEEDVVVVPVVVEIILLLRARHDDDNRAERVAVHAAQDAMILNVCVM